MGRPGPSAASGLVCRGQSRPGRSKGSQSHRRGKFLLSDHDPRITPEVIEAAMARDTRMRKIAAMIDVQSDLRDNNTLKMLFAAARADADYAVNELAELSPADMVRV